MQIGEFEPSERNPHQFPSSERGSRFSSLLGHNLDVVG